MKLFPIGDYEELYKKMTFLHCIENGHDVPSSLSRSDLDQLTRCISDLNKVRKKHRVQFFLLIPKELEDDARACKGWIPKKDYFIKDHWQPNEIGAIANWRIIIDENIYKYQLDSALNNDAYQCVALFYYMVNACSAENGESWRPGKSIILRATKKLSEE
jgi:hypothetical protein